MGRCDWKLLVLAVLALAGAALLFCRPPVGQANLPPAPQPVAAPGVSAQPASIAAAPVQGAAAADTLVSDLLADDPKLAPPASYLFPDFKDPAKAKEIYQILRLPLASIRSFRICTTTSFLEDVGEFKKGQQLKSTFTISVDPLIVKEETRGPGLSYVKRTTPDLQETRTVRDGVQASSVELDMLPKPMFHPGLASLDCLLFWGRHGAGVAKDNKVAEAGMLDTAVGKMIYAEGFGSNVTDLTYWNQALGHFRADSIVLTTLVDDQTGFVLPKSVVSRYSETGERGSWREAAITDWTSIEINCPLDYRSLASLGANN